jgi:hypothetical protein
MNNIEDRVRAMDKEDMVSFIVDVVYESSNIDAGMEDIRDIVKEHELTPSFENEEDEEGDEE